MISRRNKKFRGSRTHGKGAKAGRGKGHTGGSGMSGLGKHEKMRLRDKHTFFGRRGFTRAPQARGTSKEVTLSELVRVVNYFQLEEENVFQEINLRRIFGGYSKVKLIYSQAPLNLLEEGTTIVLTSASSKVREALEGRGVNLKYVRKT